MRGANGAARTRRTRAAVAAALTLTVLPAAVAVGIGPDRVGMAPAATVIVAAPDGAGTSCTTAAPCSLGEAQATERRLAPTMTGDIDVVLEGGTYALQHPLRLTTADSGRDGHRVEYRAAPHAVPTLSGGRAVTGWRRVPGTQNTWVALVPAGFDTRQLFVNGRRLPMASGAPPGLRWVQTGTGFILPTTAMDKWPDPTGIQVVFRGGNGPWTETSCPIASISGTTVTMAEPCWHNLHLKAFGVQELAWEDDPMGGFGGLAPWKSPTKLLNAYPLLRPGHWSINRRRHVIYYQPTGRSDPNSQQVVAPALQTLLQVAGSRRAPVHDVTIQGLRFVYGGWTAPDNRNGFPQMQADWYLKGAGANNREGTCQYTTPRGSCPFASWTRTPANVVITGGHRIRVLGNTFTHLGGAGLDVYDGSRDVLVKGNSFTDISASAIQLGATDDARLSDVGGRPANTNADDTITDNYISRAAIQYLGGIGIWLGYTVHAVVTHNQVAHLPYTGISIGWGGWHSSLLQPNIDANVNAHNVIAHNLIYDYMLQLGDGGAIYSNGSQALSWKTALHEHDNVAYFGRNTDFSLYTDAASQYIVLNRNFVYEQPFDSFDTGGCRTIGHIRIHDNWFAQGGPSYPCFAYVDVQSANNTTVCEDTPPAQAPLRIAARAGLQPAYRHLAVDRVPEVALVGPSGVAKSGGTKVLVSGSGFQRGVVVRFGHRTARAVKVLSANYLVATAPAGNGTVAVTVRSAHGTSTASRYNRVQYVAKPGHCIDYTGTNFTTKLFTG
jgi:hypothetical protein